MLISENPDCWGGGILTKRLWSLTLHVHPLLFPKLSREILDFLGQSPLNVLGRHHLHICGPFSGPYGVDEGGTPSEILHGISQCQWNRCGRIQSLLFFVDYERGTGGKDTLGDIVL